MADRPNAVATGSVQVRETRPGRSAGIRQKAARAAGAALAVSLAFAGGPATAQHMDSVRLQVDNTTDLSIRMPDTAAASDGCNWAGTASVLSAGGSDTFPIAPADGRATPAPCRLSIQAPILAGPGGPDRARMDLGIGIPTGDIMTVSIHYAYPLAADGDSGAPWVRMPVLQTELRSGSDGIYHLDLAPLGQWLRQNQP